MTSSYAGDMKLYDTCRTADITDYLSDIAYEQEQAMRESEPDDAWIGVDDVDDEPLLWSSSTPLTVTIINDDGTDGKRYQARI